MNEAQNAGVPMECAIISLAEQVYSITPTNALEMAEECPIAPAVKATGRSLGGKVSLENKLILLQRFQIGIAVSSRNNIIISLLG
jgi:hypothetical protein